MKSLHLYKHLDQYRSYVGLEGPGPLKCPWLMYGLSYGGLEVGSPPTPKIYQAQEEMIVRNQIHKNPI